MNDDFLDGLATSWRASGTLDTASWTARILRRRQRLTRDAVLTLAGAVLNVVLAACFGLWAIHSGSLLVAVGAAAFASAVPLLISSRRHIVGQLAFAYDKNPDSVVAALKAGLDDERRRLGDARGCVVILAVATVVAVVLVAVGLEAASALLPASAWFLTAALIEGWRLRAARQLARDTAALNHFRLQMEDMT